MSTAHRFREWPTAWRELAVAEYRGRSTAAKVAFPLWLAGAALLWTVVVPVAVAGWVAHSHCYNI